MTYRHVGLLRMCYMRVIKISFGCLPAFLMELSRSFPPPLFGATTERNSAKYYSQIVSLQNVRKFCLNRFLVLLEFSQGGILILQIVRLHTPGECNRREQQSM